MLNALNSIGSQMQGKPHAEKVISRLGESINILYGFTQKNEFTLPFKNEWKLVENSIEIQRLLFLPELTFTVTNENLIPVDYKIPVGLLQIPIENALLHGLRNKIDGNCILKIDFKEDENHYLITISDNGVGREKAMQINNFKKNGNGLKTIFEMISIINKHQKNAIVFEIIDEIEPLGTLVKITLNKNIEYEKIKI
jgi:LytS/YehU family sensor histidine kinase